MNSNRETTSFFRFSSFEWLVIRYFNSVDLPQPLSPSTTWPCRFVVPSCSLCRRTRRNQSSAVSLVMLTGSPSTHFDWDACTRSYFLFEDRRVTLVPENTRELCHSISVVRANSSFRVAFATAARRRSIDFRSAGCTSSQSVSGGEVEIFSRFLLSAWDCFDSSSAGKQKSDFPTTAGFSLGRSTN